jgi:hypothetical protein
LSPDIRQHRGAHPADKLLFSEDQLPLVRRATTELSWLLTRGYKMQSSLKLVGDRFALTARQRLAVSRAACSDQDLERRRRFCVFAADVNHEKLLVDGFNLIITVEAALSGGLLLFCRDGCIRDLSSVHGSYRSVTETEDAICLIGKALEEFMPVGVTWFLDRPISNSGRLSAKIADLASRHRWSCDVRVVFNPDKEIVLAKGIAVSSDSSILDRVERWLNLGAYLIAQDLRRFWLVDLRPEHGGADLY